MQLHTAGADSLRQGQARDGQAGPAKDLFLTVQRQMITVFGDHHVGQQMHPNLPVDEVRVEAVAQRDVGNRGSGLGALLNDMRLEGFGIGTALWLHESPLKRLEMVSGSGRCVGQPVTFERIQGELRISGDTFEIHVFYQHLYAGDAK